MPIPLDPALFEGTITNNSALHPQVEYPPQQQALLGGGTKPHVAVSNQVLSVGRIGLGLPQESDTRFFPPPRPQNTSTATQAIPTVAVPASMRVLDGQGFPKTYAQAVAGNTAQQHNAEIDTLDKGTPPYVRQAIRSLRQDSLSTER